MLAILISHAKEDGQVAGLVPHLVEGGVSILQYADDTILFLEHDIAKAVNIFFRKTGGILPAPFKKPTTQAGYRFQIQKT